MRRFLDVAQDATLHVKRYAIVPASFLGFALCRRWSSWLTLYAPAGFMDPGVYDAMLTIVNIVSLTALAFAAYRFGPLLCKGTVVIGSAVSLSLGSLLIWLFGESSSFAIVGAVLAHAGFSGMFLLWLELYGSLDPRRMIVAYCGSMLAYGVLFAFFGEFVTGIAPVIVSFFPLASAVCLLWSYQQLDPATIPQRGTEPVLSCFAQIKHLLVWTAAFSFAYGMGESITHLGTAGYASVIGRCVFSAVIVVGILFFWKRFTLRIVYRIVLPLTIASLATVFFFDVDHGMAQAFMSAGMEGFQALSLVVCCGIALRKKVSSAFLCGIVFMVETLLIQVGRIVHVTLQETYDLNHILVGTVVILVLVVVTTFFFTENDLITSYSERTLMAKKSDDRTIELLEHCAVEFELSPKETIVFELMAKGLSTRQIAEKLYLSQGTIRAHSSKIYQKMNVKSRREFDDLMRSR